MHSLIAGPKFVDAIPQKVRLWAPQFMTQFAQTVNTPGAFSLHLRRKGFKPLQKQDGIIFRLPKE